MRRAGATVPWPFSLPLFNGVRGRGVLRTSAVGGSKKFATYSFLVAGAVHRGPRSPPGPLWKHTPCRETSPVWARQRSPVWGMRPWPARHYNRDRFRPGTPLFPPPRNGDPAFFMPLCTRVRGRGVLRSSVSRLLRSLHRGCLGLSPWCGEIFRQALRNLGAEDRLPVGHGVDRP